MVKGHIERRISDRPDAGGGSTNPGDQAVATTVLELRRELGSGALEHAARNLEAATAASDHKRAIFWAEVSIILAAPHA